MWVFRMALASVRDAMIVSSVVMGHESVDGTGCLSRHTDGRYRNNELYYKTYIVPVEGYISSISSKDEPFGLFKSK